MSFLNPVNEPVLRFSSTDADAPQINYAARTAGDVKTVLKACLVTGYGAKASAGWSIVNEVDHVAEFVSPSAAMSDYRLGIDDTSASSTTWYYQYQNVQTNPAYNSPVKSFTEADKTSGENGWQMLVTDRGIIFAELVKHVAMGKLSARITYFGQIKSAEIATGRNIMFFNIGHSSTMRPTNNFYSTSTFNHVRVNTHTSAFMTSIGSEMLAATLLKLDSSVVDLVSPIYMLSSTKDTLIGELPSMLSQIVNKTEDLYGVSELAINGVNMLKLCAGLDNLDIALAMGYSRTFLIPVDYWGY